MTSLGFIGLGHMGEPMASNLCRAGVPLTVWNRTTAKAQRLSALGATSVPSPADVFDRCDVVLLMLADAGAIDAVLARDGSRFGVTLSGRTVVNMGTVGPAYSEGLGADLTAAGARYAEAPVSGSRVPAEAGELVAMLAGPTRALDVLESLLAPMCSTTVRCGEVPHALETKLAVNVFLISMVAGLAEAVHFAESGGVDLEVLRAVLDAGPMASAVSRLKLAKLVGGDLEPQASVRDVHYNSRLILEAAAGHATAVPLLSVCTALFAEAEAHGLGAADMVGVLDAIRRRDSPSGDVTHGKSQP